MTAIPGGSYRTGPTPPPGDNSTRLATTAYVAAQFARTPIADKAYVVLTTDRTVAITSLSAARTLTLPAASAYPLGVDLTVQDESGSCSGTNAVTINAAGSDTINGAASYTISTPYGYVALSSNGAGKWTVVDSPLSGATNAVRYDAAQSLTVAQQLQALANEGITLAGRAPINLSLSASVASNALTVSVLGANGAAPSASNPVYIPFKTASGGLAWLTVTSALSLTVPSGATLGTLSGKLARVWVVAINNGGSPLLGVQVCTDGATAIYSLGQSYPETSVAIGVSSTSAGTLYAASAVTGYIAVLGCVEATEATAGTWATAPSVVRRWIPGDKLPGDVEQVVTASNGTANNNNTNAYATNGSFQGVGGQITPKSAANAVRARASGGMLYNPGTNVIASIRVTRGSSGSTAAEGGEYFFANGGTWGSNSSMQTMPTLELIDWPATTSATSYGTQLKNGDNSSNIVYPNAGTARIVIEELVV